MRGLALKPWQGFCWELKANGFLSDLSHLLTSERLEPNSYSLGIVCRPMSSLIFSSVTVLSSIQLSAQTISSRMKCCCEVSPPGSGPQVGLCGLGCGGPLEGHRSPTISKEIGNCWTGLLLEETWKLWFLDQGFLASACGICGAGHGLKRLCCASGRFSVPGLYLFDPQSTPSPPGWGHTRQPEVSPDIDKCPLMRRGGAKSTLLENPWI